MSRKNENQVVVTRSGHESMKKELAELKGIRRPEVARMLDEARAFGDLSENAEYAAAKEEQSKVEGRILELEAMLAKVTVIDEDKLDTTRVSIGLTVTLQDLDLDKSHTYALVGSEELASSTEISTPIQRISQKSPVGQAIMGHVVGDEVTVKIPRGTRRLKITNIDRGSSPAPKKKSAKKKETHKA